eukprot:jgi/Mesvir1/12647/Mv02202-RA.2
MSWVGRTGTAAAAAGACVSSAVLAALGGGIPVSYCDTKEQPPAKTVGLSGFDPEALERGAKALREINASPHAKKVLELSKQQEETKVKEAATEMAKYQAMQAQAQVEREKVHWEEQRKTMQQNLQQKAKVAQYEDELARNRMQLEHESQRQRNVELVKLQEESLMKQETVRRQTEERIQAERRQTDEHRAQLERETLRVKALAEAEGRVLENRQNEDVNRRQLLARMDAEKDKLLAAISATFKQVGEGFTSLASDRNKQYVVVGGVTLLAAGVYGAREGTKLAARMIEKAMGQPTLVRETTRLKPWARGGGFLSKEGGGGGAVTAHSVPTGALGAREGDAAAAAAESHAPLTRVTRRFGDVILNKELLERVSRLAVATANTKLHGAPFRHMLFYGPPGTGKTMAARTLAQKSGLDYAMMSGGDIGPLKEDAVTKIHELFDWAKSSKKGLLLFIDEADAFLSRRGTEIMSENLRSALNAVLFRTGDQTRDFVLVVATNRPKDLDPAVVDRMDEAIEFPLPGKEERLNLLHLYLDKYIVHPQEDKKRPWYKRLFGYASATRTVWLS